jgi:hypothetical protein
MQSTKYSHRRNFHRFILSPISITFTSNLCLLFTQFQQRHSKNPPELHRSTRLASIIHIQRSSHPATHQSLQGSQIIWTYTARVQYATLQRVFSTRVSVITPFSFFFLSTKLIVRPDRSSLDHRYHIATSYAASLFSTSKSLYCQIYPVRRGSERDIMEGPLLSPR